MHKNRYVLAAAAEQMKSADTQALMLEALWLVSRDKRWEVSEFLDPNDSGWPDRTKVRKLAVDAACSYAKDDYVAQLCNEDTWNEYVENIRRYRENPDKRGDVLSYPKKSAQLYVGFVESDKQGNVEPIVKMIKIAPCFENLLQSRNAEKLEKARQLYERRKKLLKIKNRVYATRTPPPMLRAIVLERDNHTCQICLQPKDILEARGSFLEIDHKEEWEDGGKTTYHNLQATCRECNIGKHHAKRLIEPNDENLFSRSFPARTKT